ncbi:MAG: hypothetical protein NT167_29360 [Verrucomicrobia bacterium]|nr:hypothetical protein [Verrucomicrobiota bacterium]
MDTTHNQVSLSFGAAKRLFALLGLGVLANVGILVASDAPIWLTTNYTYTVPSGQVVNLRAIADGAAPLNYFWLSNGVPIPNLATNTLAVIASTNTATCPFSAVASNAFGMITNGPCFVKVLGGCWLLESTLVVPCRCMARRRAWPT